MKLEFLSKILEEAEIGMRGRDIFLHEMAADIETGIMLRLPIAGVATDLNLPDYYKAEIQVIVRSPKQAVGTDLYKRITPLLTMYRRTFNDDDGNFVMEIKQMYPSKLPIRYPRSDSNSIEWSLNFYANYVMKE